MISVKLRTPTLKLTPPGDMIFSGESVTLTCVTAITGAGVTYNYIKDGTTFHTVDKDTHVMNDVTTTGTGSYTCTVTKNSLTSEPSDARALTVIGEYIKVKVKAFKILSQYIHKRDIL